MMQIFHPKVQPYVKFYHIAVLAVSIATLLKVIRWPFWAYASLLSPLLLLWGSWLILLAVILGVSCIKFIRSKNKHPTKDEIDSTIDNVMGKIKDGKNPLPD